MRRTGTRRRAAAKAVAALQNPPSLRARQAQTVPLPRRRQPRELPPPKLPATVTALPQPDPPPGRNWFWRVIGLQVGPGCRNFAQWRPSGQAWQNMLAEGPLYILSRRFTRAGVTHEVYFVTSTSRPADLLGDFDAWFTGHRVVSRTHPTHFARKFFGYDPVALYSTEQIERLSENAWWSQDDGVIMCFDQAIAEQVIELLGGFQLRIAN